MSEEVTIKALAERFWAWQCHEFPLTAFIAGVKTTDPVLFREAPQDHERRHGEVLTFIAQLDATKVPATSRERADAALLRRELEDLRDFHLLGAHQRPWLLPVGPEFNTIYFANLCSLGDARAAEFYLAQLGTLPQFFDDIGANLRDGRARGFRYPKVVLARAEANMRAVTQGPVEKLPWFGAFVRSPTAWPQAEAAKALIGDLIVPALTRLADVLRDELAPCARDSIAASDDVDGERYYQRWVRHFTNLDMTPEALHALGISEAARVEQEIEQVAADAGFAGRVTDYRKHLAEAPEFFATSGEALRERVEITAKRIDRLIPNYIGRVPRITYGVESIPESLAPRMPPAYAQPSPGDRSTSGILWVSGLPGKCPLYMIPSLTLHEGWPGHLMHLALVQEIEDVPAFCRYNGPKYSACVEGWALYCEGLGEAMGLYKTPHEHFGRLDMELWRALRLVVDTGIHAKGWTREQAIQELATRVSLSLDTIEAEVDRYIALPAQALAYQIGNIRFREFRALAESKLGKRFNLRTYHDKLLGFGTATLPVIGELLDEWLAEEAAA
ncbi:DUF885 domain-containing protein [Roseateles toxinivorans]|uniref:Uncharacterized protein (DUF885 family) n=1 Tax=Roseateles toxinivorans TaxID=270368 RepID=A0A4R6QGP9_9BURK|nr:DUF885 domain-containing protein [Roseateles toxinivorans]TDP61236.1 uncharacterized protein (DUF885 family) [Roseateles toxinivorans]